MRAPAVQACSIARRPAFQSGVTPSTTRNDALAPLRTVTTPLRLAFLVGDAQADVAVRALHAALVVSPL